MAEKLVSPGVFTKENDLSFLQQGNPLVLTITSGSVGQTTGLVSASVGILFPTHNNVLSTGLSGSAATTAGNGLLGSGDIVMFVTGSTNYAGTSSLDPEDTNDIESVFGTNPRGAKGGYVYGFFKNHGIGFGQTVSSSVNLVGDQDFSIDAQEALTPYIQSQQISGERYNLFQIETIGVGNAANTKIKIGITNIKAAGSVAGTDYGTFTIVVRAFDDTNKKKNVLETFANVNLDPNSPNFISRVIGDRKLLIATDGKVTESGDWVNNSKYIRIANLNESAPVQAVPFGHAAYKLPISMSAALSNMVPTASMLEASATVYGGIDLDGNSDNKIYMKPIPANATNGSNVAFGLDAVNGGSLAVGSTSAQFVVAFQEGFDGMAPTVAISKGEDITAGNSQGFDLTNSTSTGTTAYMKHINALSNADEWDINMVVVPGVNRNQHSSVWTSILDMVEQRADAFFIADAGNPTTTLTQTVTQAESVDSNYAAVYYPWVKTIDINTNKLITVPPSVLLPGVFAANDRVAAEWFAPAGLNRGDLH